MSNIKMIIQPLAWTAEERQLRILVLKRQLLLSDGVLSRVRGETEPNEQGLLFDLFSIGFVPNGKNSRPCRVFAGNPTGHCLRRTGCLDRCLIISGCFLGELGLILS